MTDQKTSDCAEAISFDRLHALAQRGYRANLGHPVAESGLSRIDLSHPRVHGKNVPPRVTVWSNGILATDGLLWPSRFVPQEEGLPTWQKFIDARDRKRFDEFVSSVPRPNIVDTFVRPLLLATKVFVARLLFGAALTASLAMSVRVVLKLI